MKNTSTFFLICLLLFCVSNGTAQWVLTSKAGFPATISIIHCLDAVDINTAVISIVSLSPSENSIYATVDGGGSWKKIFSDPKLTPVDLSIMNATHIWYAGSNGGIYSTSDGGGTWQRQYNDSANCYYMDYIEMFDLNNGIAAGTATIGKNLPALFLRTTDGGQHWISMNQTDLINDYSGDVWRRIDFVSPDVGYFSSSKYTGLFKTMNGGKTWTKVLSDNPIVGLIKFYNENVGVILYRLTNDVHRTTDGGTTWETLTKGFTWPRASSFTSSTPSQIWAVASSNLYFSSDTGRTWKSATTLSSSGQDLKFVNDNTGWIVCRNGDVYRTTNAGGMITATDDQRHSLPTQINLEQNYPNPFNPSTTIQFSLPEQSSVLLTVFDQWGRELTTLVNGDRSAGSHTVRFDGSSYTSGIYYYRLTTGKSTQTRKFVLLK